MNCGVKRNGDRAEMSWFWYGMDGKLAPPVSIEDRSVVGSADRGLNSTNHIPEVGGSRNR